MPLDDFNPEQTAKQFSNRLPPAKSIGQLRFASVIICIIIVCLGFSVILGWLLDIALLKSVVSDRVTMKFSTALGLILAGISLLLWHQQQSQKNLWISTGLYLLPSIAIAFSFITLIEYGFNLDLGTSWLSVSDSADAIDAIVQGRMSPSTALSFLLLNAAILLLVQKYYLTAQLLTIGIIAIAIISLIGHIYDLDLLYSAGSATGMAIHTGVGFILLALAFLGTCSDRGWMRVITREEAGGLMARWLLPLVVIIPPALGGLFWLLFQSNVYYLELIIALRIITEMMIFGVMVWWIAQKLNQSDRQKQQLYVNLLEVERQFRAIFNQTFQFIGLLTPNGTLLQANQTALDFGGITQADVVGKPFWEAYWWRISPETQRQLQQAIALASKGEFVRYPVAVQGANKKVITIDFSLRPVKDETGKIILLIPEGRDISKQVAIERALEASEARYRAIVEDQTELICRYRADSTISFVNEAYCRYFGGNKEKLRDRTFTPRVYDADRELITQKINSMSKTNPSVTITHRVWLNDELHWNQWNNRVILDEHGEISEYQAVGRDITALKQVEAKLRESEEKFRRAFEDAATGEVLASPEGKLLQVNRSFCEIVGYSEPELLDKTFSEITYFEDRKLDLDYLQRILSGEIRIYQTEKRYIHQQGHLVWVLLNVSAVRDTDGKIMYFIAQIQDINQRKQAEAKLNALLQELERSNQELEEFASVVAHDLISPLRKQNLFIELLQEDCSEALNEEGNEYLDRMFGLNSRMRSLIHHLLTYARVTSQAQPFTQVPLNEVINSILDELETEIAHTQAQIEVGELPIVMGDRLQLGQLFQNLLQNALKFRDRNRIPQIKIERLPSNDEQLEANFYRIAVTDNGIGFEPEQQQKIFTPFHRLYSYSKYEGTGLGLAICHKIVKRHQGKIIARSQPGKGATFIISLPKR